jgi:hypothetical protein
MSGTLSSAVGGAMDKSMPEAFQELFAAMDRGETDQAIHTIERFCFPAPGMWACIQLPPPITVAMPCVVGEPRSTFDEVPTQVVDRVLKAMEEPAPPR